MDDVRGGIASLEERIERLSEQRERCRKVAYGAKAAIGGGAMLLAALVFGVISGDALRLMIAAILLLGGFVLAGSNQRTADEYADEIAKAERSRAELISGIELRLVPEASRMLH